MKTSADIRRENLLHLINTKFQGVKNRLANHVGVTHMQIARVFHKGKTSRNVGDKLARKIEASLGIELGWLDNDHANTDKLGAKFASLNLKQRLAVENMIDALISEPGSE